MTIGRPFISEMEIVLTLLLPLGSLLVIASMMATRALQPDLAARAARFVPRRDPDDPEASPAKLVELQELRSQFLFLRSVEIYGIGYFLALPAFAASMVLPGLELTLVGLRVSVPGICGNFAAAAAAAAMLLTCHAYLCHRLGGSRMLGLADRLCHIRHRIYE